MIGDATDITDAEYLMVLLLICTTGVLVVSFYNPDFDHRKKIFAYDISYETFVIDFQVRPEAVDRLKSPKC